MKKITLLLFSALLPLLSFAQNKDIVGVWKLERFDVDAKTNYPLLTKLIVDRFHKSIGLKDENPIFISFTEDGNTYENSRLSEKYRTKEDSIYVGDIQGKFSVKNNQLTILCDILEEFIGNPRQMSPEKLKELQIPDIDSILVERAIIKIQFQKQDTIIPIKDITPIDISEIPYAEDIPMRKAMIRDDDEKDAKPFVNIEQWAQFPGGEAAMMKFVTENLRYPAITKEEAINDRSVVRFVVQKDGKITDIQVIRKMTPAIDEEVIRMVKSMPDWEPGKQNGIAVPLHYTLPITVRFRLPEKETSTKQ